MLQLKNITKNYYVGDSTVEALKGISICFRKNEFVSILGPSGCGKTTLLNIIGGLDRYTSGDIVINGVSTTLYSDSDWDSYRNHSIGFVFQSYNLIPHQTVLANVELALTLSGIKPQERRERAIEALKKVGLEDHIKKLPSQLSGGQMQRVAIARAIVNDPEIILADEPTGALDTETSIQVMDILKELSLNKLIIMVTHNPDLAEKYSSRIIKLKDGTLRADNDPYEYTVMDKVHEAENSDLVNEKNEDKKVNKKKKKEKKPSMSFWTALTLSFKNLKTKLARTILTSFAGSIGIIGIALILSLSSGFSGYINKVQRDTLSNYPVSVGKQAWDMASFAASYMDVSQTDGLKEFPQEDVIVPDKMIQGMLESITKTYGVNDLKSFKEYLDNHPDLIDPTKISALAYTYNFNKHIYQKEENNYFKEINKLPPSINDFLPGSDSEDQSDKPDFIKFQQEMEATYNNFKNVMESGGPWDELLPNNKLIKSQYEVLAGDWPSQEPVKDGEAWPLVIVVDKYNRIPDYALYMMGILKDKDVQYIFTSMIFKKMEEMSKGAFNADDLIKKYFGDYSPYAQDMSFESMIGREYSVVLDGQYYTEVTTPEPGYKQFAKKVNPEDPEKEYDYEHDQHFIDEVIKKAPKVKVTGILRLKKGSTSGALSQNIYYTPAFTQHLMEITKEIPVVKEQLRNDANVETDGYYFDCLTGKKVNQTEQEKLSELKRHRKEMGMVDADSPAGISIYPTSFENKDYVINIIEDYNQNTQSGKDSPIKYTDYIGMMMDSITIIINSITYVLIAFISVSLIVSSIMIGVITYISVLERTKEIGILRAIGASKRDVGRVFNAETFIVGLTAGLIGVIITALLNIPISIIINMLAGIPGIAVLNIVAALILVAISVLLTLIAGLIPSRMASKKDPVIALRSE